MREAIEPAARLAELHEGVGVDIFEDQKEHFVWKGEDTCIFFNWGLEARRIIDCRELEAQQRIARKV
jgi:hypothetical protein